LSKYIVNLLKLTESTAIRTSTVTEAASHSTAVNILSATDASHNYVKSPPVI